MGEIRLDKLSCEDFTARVNERFTLHAGAESLDLTLVEAKPLGASQREGGAFSLVFRAAGETHAPQGTYTLKNEHLGQLEVFLVPLGADAEGMRYEAVFA
jgi:hypothetical protein